MQKLQGFASKAVDHDGHVGLSMSADHAKEILKGFVADVLLGNWDVLGASGDNIVKGKDGKLHRIDNGGALFH